MENGCDLLVVIFLFAYIFTFCMLIVTNWYESFSKFFSVTSNIYNETLILHFCGARQKWHKIWETLLL